MAAAAKPKRVTSSHAVCDHPSTKSARAACRRERAKAAAEPVQPEPKKPRREKAMLPDKALQPWN